MKKFKILKSIGAGDNPKIMNYKKNASIEIMTGAIIPRPFNTIIPVEKVKGQLHQLSADGNLQIESHEFAKEHTIAGVEELSLIRDFIRVRGPED